MKKILLSAAMFAAVITGANAQCTAPTTTQAQTYWMEHTRLINTAAGEAQMFANVSSAAPVDGYVDSKSTVVDLTPGENYGIAIFSNKVGGSRTSTHVKVWIDFNDNGSFEDSGEEVFASIDPLGSGFIDGLVRYGSHEAFDLASDAVLGAHTMRYAMQVSTDAANPITACDEITDGSMEDFTVNIVDPNAVPPTAANDIAVVLQDVATTINVIANDVEGSSAIISGAVDVEPISGTYVVNADNTITYTPNSGFRGVDGFTYKITNTAGESNSAAVRVVVYGYKEVDGKQVLIIEDFDTMDETVGGILNDDDGYGWDGSFAWALNTPGGSKSDETSDVKEGAGAMLISISASPDAGIVMDDTHTGNKVSLADDATKFQFSAADNNNVMGMWVMPYEIYAGMKFGFMLKRVDAFDADGDGESGTSYADKYISAYVDGADMTDWGFNFVGVDLSSIEDEYKGAYVLHKLRYAFDANANTSDFVIDEIGLYPASNLSSVSIELEGVSVYPNPVQNVLNIKAGSNATVTVLNTIGSKVYEGEAKTISTQSWKKGLYFVVVKEGNASKTVKVIK